MTESKAIRHQMKQDVHCPQYHFLPSHIWMHSPNEVIFWNGQYHLFYQLNLDYTVANAGNRIHWGHAVSRDLVHWDDLSPELSPTPGSPDAGGVQSGCVVNHDGVAVGLYTAVHADGSSQSVCLATSTHPQLSRWEKYPANAVIAAAPAEYAGCEFRDPYVWRGRSMWYMVIGAGKPGGAEVVLLYRSWDLYKWEFLYPIYESDRQNDLAFMHPSFFRLGEKWVLLLSHIDEATGEPHAEYIVGNYTGHTFIPQHRHQLDYGLLTAPRVTQDEHQRWLLWGGIREYDQSPERACWSGVQSLPRVISLNDDNTLSFAPLPELQRLRRSHRHYDLSSGIADEDAGWSVSGVQLELDLRLLLSADDFTLNIAGSDAAQLQITYCAADCVLIAGASTISLSPLLSPAPDKDESQLRLHIFVDHSVIECLVNERVSITERLYSTSPFEIFFTGKKPKGTINVWEMSDIWT